MGVVVTVEMGSGGCLERPHKVLVGSHQVAEALEGSWTALSSAGIGTQRRCAEVGLNQTDCGRQGSKQHHSRYHRAGYTARYRKRSACVSNC